VARPPDHAPIAVVLAPDVLGKAFFNADCRRVLHLWRDGRIRPAVTPGLLRIYVGVLRALSVPDSQIRRWLWWFTDRDAALFLSEPSPGTHSLQAILNDAAERAGARSIVSTTRAPNGAGESDTAEWTDPATLTERLSSMRG
jgi:hypothetical protein